jgi:hypothetical protein
VLSAALFGALAGCRELPFEDAAFEATVQRAGVGVQASLRFGREQKLAIPQAAVLLQAGQTFVFRAVQPAEAQRLIGAPITPAPSASVPSS